ncbi:MAG TPA: hypothetical protein VHJ76_02045 [Actinomycetota bacterium]|nr:hypothetical protein [Actinomycetota bacterium]
MPAKGDPEAIVVRQHSRTADALWGFIVVALGVALFRGRAGAETDAGRLAGDLLFGGLIAVSIAAWAWFRRRPSTLTIARDAISFSHRSGSEGIVLRRTGDLYVATPLGPGGDHRQRYLRVEGSDGMIPLLLFDWKTVRSACVAMGWRFAEPRS